MPQKKLERELLFGFLAIQNDFITSDLLVATVRAWLREKKESLETLLVQQGALTDEQASVLRALVQLHLNQDSLNILDSRGGDRIRRELESLNDSALNTSLAHLTSTPRADDPFATTVAVPRDFTPDRRFQFIRGHARGGLGRISLALEKDLNRRVAIKEIQERFADDPSCRSRFVLEAQVNGSLEHPGIVPVYGFGKDSDGRPYYAMRFIEGDTLEAAIQTFHSPTNTGRSQRNLELRKALSQFVQVCNTIGYAHSRGVIHRDLKPSNILLGSHGETLVVDWGLAKIIGVEGVDTSTVETAPDIRSASETVAGSVVGTPAYMAPEQARGDIHQLGPATDIYSLGATFYHLLTGAPPFQEVSIELMLARVRRGDFTDARSKNPNVSRPLNAICLRAMALSPGNRFQTCEHFAEEINRYLADEPTSSYSETRLEKSGRWIRKNRSAAVSATLALGLFAVIMTLATVILQEKNSQYQSGLYLALTRLSQTALVRGDTGDLEMIFEEGFENCDASLRSWEYGYVVRSMHSEEAVYRVSEKGLRLACLSDDSTRLLSVDNANLMTLWQVDGAKELWKRPTGKEEIVSMAIYHGAQQTLLGMGLVDPNSGQNSLVLWDPLANELKYKVQVAGVITAIAFSRDGRRIAWSEQAQNDTESASLVLANSDEIEAAEAIVVPSISRANCLRFDTTDSQIAVGGHSLRSSPFPKHTGHFSVIDCESKSVVSARRGQYPVFSIDFSPTGSELLVGYDWGLLEQWDLPLEVDSRPFNAWQHASKVNSIAFSPNGNNWASGSYDRSITLSGTGTYRDIHGHWSPVLAVAFSPNSEFLVSVGSSGIIRKWSVRRGQNQSMLPMFAANTGYLDCQFTESGNLVALLVSDAMAPDATDSQIVLFDKNYRMIQREKVRGIGHTAVRVHPDGVRCLILASDGSVTQFSFSDSPDSPSTQSLLPLKGVVDARFLDDTTLVCGTDTGALITCDMGGTILRTVDTDSGKICCVSVSKDGQFLVTASMETVQLWNRDFQELSHHTVSTTPILRCAISDDGGMFAISSGGFGASTQSGDAVVWRRSGKEMVRLVGGVDLLAGVRGIGFSRDSKRLFMTSFDYRTIVLRLDDGEPLFDLIGHESAVGDLAISPDGLRLATVGLSGHVLIQEAADWR